MMAVGPQGAESERIACHASVGSTSLGDPPAAQAVRWASGD
jgi:hypothetical protein